MDNYNKTGQCVLIHLFTSWKANTLGQPILYISLWACLVSRQTTSTTDIHTTSLKGEKKM